MKDHVAARARASLHLRAQRIRRTLLRRSRDHPYQHGGDVRPEKRGMGPRRGRRPQRGRRTCTRIRPALTVSTASATTVKLPRAGHAFPRRYFDTPHALPARLPLPVCREASSRLARRTSWYIPQVSAGHPGGRVDRAHLGRRAVRAGEQAARGELRRVCRMRRWRCRARRTSDGSRRAAVCLPAMRRRAAKVVEGARD